MKRNTSNENADPGQGPSKIPKGEPQKDRLRYSSEIQSSAHGFKYQKEVAVLLLLRATLRKVRFSLAYEMKDAGHFDDVVFIDEDKNKCLLFQVKHGSTTGKMEPVELEMLFPNNATDRKKGNFSLFKYLKSYPCSQPDLPEDKRFIIFTNKQLEISDQLLKKITIEHLAPEPILYFDDSTEKPKRFEPTIETAEEIITIFNQEFANQEGAKVKQSMSKALCHSVSLENVLDFFGNFVFHFKQPNELKGIIRNELLGWIRSWMHPVHLGKIGEEDILKYCFEQLQNCLEHDSEYDKERKSKAFLTLTQGKNCLREIQNRLKAKQRVFNFANSTLTTVITDYYIDRRISETNNERADEEHDFCDHLKARCFKDKIIVLTAKPGMGKSVLFHHVSLKIQQSSNDLVFLIYLNNLIDNLKQIEKVDNLKTTLEILENVLETSYRNIILEDSKSENSNDQRIVMFLDGFDEIAPMHEEKVIQMIETLKKVNRIQVIVSGRRHVENKLMGKFTDAKCLYLMPFSKQDQKDFLKKRWKISAENESKFETYSMYILDEFNRNIGNWWCDFLGIPLMINMFAIVKETDFKRFQSSNEAPDAGSFTVVNLYEEFIEKCLDLKFEKISIIGNRENESVPDFLLKHQLLAVHQLECSEICSLLDDPSMKTKLDAFVQKIKEGKERSSLVECVNGEVQFIHRSYAEYMVAKYLYDNKEERKKLFDRMDFRKRYVVERKFLLNMIVEKDKPSQLREIAEMCKIDESLAAHAIFEEGCSNIIENAVQKNSPFVNYYYNFFSDIYPPVHSAAKRGDEKIVHLLIKKGANINVLSERKSTPLHLAIRHKSMVQLLLHYSVNVNAQNRNGETPLHEAIEDRQNDVAKMLMEHQIDEHKITAVNRAARFGKISILRPTLNKMVYENFQNGLERNPLYSVNSKNFADVCEDELKELLLHSSVDVNFEDFEGKTPLHYAVETNQLDIVKSLLGKSKCVNLQDNRGKIALHYAANTGQQNMVKLLLEQTKNPHLQDFELKTPLHYAVEAGHHQIVELLLNNSLDIVFRDDKSQLHYAAESGLLNIVELLLMKDPTEVNVEDEYGQTPLHYAAEKGHHEIVDLLLKKSANADAKDGSGNKPIHYAVANGLYEIVKLLLDKTHDIDYSNYDGKTILHNAAEAGNLQIFKLLLEKTQIVDEFDGNWRTPLHYAATRGHHQIIELLLKNTENVDVEDEAKKTPLHYAAKNGHHQSIELLLKKTENVDAQNYKGKTPLHYAVKQGHNQIVKLLLENTENVNVQDYKGKTPLHYAAIICHHQIIEILLKNKTMCVDVLDLKGKTPLHYAAEKNHYSIVNLLLEKFIREQFSIKISDSESALFSPDKQGKLPIHYAAKAGHHQIVDYLLTKSEYVVVKDTSGKTPLHYAVESGHEQIVELLLGKAVDVNLPDSDEKTPLHYATESGHQKIVELLLGKLEDINTQDKFGSTPLHYAAVGGHLEIINLFIKQSADVNVKNIFKQTPLLVAAKAGRHQTVEFLFNMSGNVNLQDNEGRTLLHYTAKSGYIDIISSLLEKAVDGDVQDNFAKSPLHYAAETGHEQIVSELLKKVKNENLLDMDGKIPLHYATESGHHKIVELLLETLEDVNSQDKFGSTPLHYAAVGGHVEIINLLINKSADVNIQNNSKQSPLILAAKAGNHQTVNLLFDKSKDFNLQDIEGGTLLHYAAEAGHYKIVDLMVKPENVLLHDNNGRIPLHYAVKSGQLQIVNLLMEKSTNFDLKDMLYEPQAHNSALDRVTEAVFGKSADLNLKDSDGQTVLHLAVERNNQQIVECLLEKSVDVNSQDTDGKTPLHIAAQEGNLQIVKLLLEKSCDVNLKDSEGSTPLHEAVVFEQMEVVQLLLENSCDINLQDKNGQTPLHYATKQGNQQIIELLLKNSCDINLPDIEGRTALYYVSTAERWDWKGKIDVPKIFDLLLGNVVDVNIMQDYEGKTLLHYAAQIEAPRTVGLLLRKLENINSKDSVGKTPLHYAAQAGSQEVVALVIEASANINLQDSKGKTPLHYAVEADYQKIVKLLLNKSVDISLQDSEGKTPLHYAAKNGNKEVGQILLKNLFDVNAQDKEGRTPLHYAYGSRRQDIVELLLKYSGDENVLDKFGKEPVHYETQSCGAYQRLHDDIFFESSSDFSSDSSFDSS